MIIGRDFSEYSILDTGDGMKLERWGEYILSRPDPQVIWRRSYPPLWEDAHALYSRSASGGGQWEFRTQLPERWVISYKNLSFYVRPTGFKHMGLFPEQCANWSYIMQNLGEGDNALNLFAYTGAATLACAAAGASVVHVDAAKSMNNWAKQSAGLSGLADKNIRYIADDCNKFVLREQRRGGKYSAVIMDPPSYGRGADGSVWKVEDDIFKLIQNAAKLLCDDAKFFIVNSYTTGLSSVVTANMLRLVLRCGSVHADDLVLPTRDPGIFLPCGTTARWQP